MSYTLADVRPAALIIAPSEPSVVEVVDRRRRHAKTYQIGPNQYQVSTRFGAIHYKDEPGNASEPWKEIDLTIAVTNAVSAAPYSIQIYTDRVGYLYTSRDVGQVSIELVEIDHLAVDNRLINTRRDGNKMFYEGLGTDLEFMLFLRPLSAEIFKRIASINAPRHFRWLIEEHVSVPLFNRRTAGADADGNRLEIQTTITPLVSTKPDTERFYYDETWTGRVSRIFEEKSRKRKWFDDPSYPVIIDATTQEDIIANADDGYHTDGTWASAYNVWHAGRWGGTIFHAGVRFQTLGVPQGATITAATLTMQVEGFSGGDAKKTKIYADDVDDAAGWSSGNLPSGITKTAASVAWTPASVATFTVGITNVVQEIISRTGWSSGNDIRFAILNAAGAGQYAFIDVHDYNAGQADAAQLDVDYSVGVEPFPPVPGRVHRDRRSPLIRM